MIFQLPFQLPYSLVGSLKLLIQIINNVTVLTGCAQLFFPQILYLFVFDFDLFLLQLCPLFLLLDGLLHIGHGFRHILQPVLECLDLLGSLITLLFGIGLLCLLLWVLFVFQVLVEKLEHLIFRFAHTTPSSVRLSSFRLSSIDCIRFVFPFFRVLNPIKLVEETLHPSLA